MTKAEYNKDALFEVLDAGIIAHAGVSIPDGPIVLPMAYARTDNYLYLHGATGNAMLSAAIGHEICVTVTLVDGLVIARTPFQHSMNYRCVVVRGLASEVLDDDEKWMALQLISDHVTPTWEFGRTPTPSELRQTRVLSIPLDEMSGKVRHGGPSDSEEDRSGPYWGGHIPLKRSWGAAVPDVGLSPDVPVPPGVAELEVDAGSSA